MSSLLRLGQRCLPAFLLLVSLFAAAPAQALEGRAVDAHTGQPVAGLSVRLAGQPLVLAGDAQGRFSLPEGYRGALQLRAPGYRRLVLASDGATAPLARLQPLRPKALYLSVFGIGNKTLRDGALALVGQTELDALVIDVKGDRGLVPYRSAAHLAAGLGPQGFISVADMPALLASLRERGLYLIARIVVFKDDPLAQAHPQWAVADPQGRGLWKDREGLAWIDPFRREAWDYSLALAEEAARLGFDEVQFDYLRFPDATGLSFSAPNTRENRVAAISGFLDAARLRLAPYDISIAADIFGYVAWNSDDTQIGQQLEELARHADVLCPMLYPSGFSHGIPGHPDPVTAPYAIVEQSLKRLLQRSGLSPLRVRPWLQAFRDYAFDRRVFDADEIRAQIDAAEQLGTGGWMLWNAANRYEAGGLRPEVPTTTTLPVTPSPAASAPTPRP